jgi:hypothetical protein
MLITVHHVNIGMLGNSGFRRFSKGAIFLTSHIWSEKEARRFNCAYGTNVPPHSRNIICLTEITERMRHEYVNVFLQHEIGHRVLAHRENREAYKKNAGIRHLDRSSSFSDQQEREADLYAAIMCATSISAAILDCHVAWHDVFRATPENVKRGRRLGVRIQTEECDPEIFFRNLEYNRAVHCQEVAMNERTLEKLHEFRNKIGSNIIHHLDEPVELEHIYY